MKPRIVASPIAARALAAAMLVTSAGAVMVPAATGAERHPSATAARAATPRDTAAAAARARALREGWPDTPAGMVASRWVTAFSTGEEAMRAFLEAHLGADALAKRPMKERLASYRSLHERYGSLMLAEVVESKSTELTVRLLGEDAARRAFVFTVEKDAPHRLVSVGIRESGHGHGAGGH